MRRAIRSAEIPIEAIGILAAHVLSVRCKDGKWSPPDQPHIGYQGPLTIERESPDPAERLRDIASATRLLRTS